MSGFVYIYFLKLNAHTVIIPTMTWIADKRWHFKHVVSKSDFNFCNVSSLREWGSISNHVSWKMICQFISGWKKVKKFSLHFNSVIDTVSLFASRPGPYTPSITEDHCILWQVWHLCRLYFNERLAINLVTHSDVIEDFWRLWNSLTHIIILGNVYDLWDESANEMHLCKTATGWFDSRTAQM